MEYLRKAIYGPTPQEQYRTCQQTLRRNKRSIDRQITDLNNNEKKTKTLIKTAAKKNDSLAIKTYARELRNMKRVNERLHVSRATLDSIEMKLNEQQQLIKIKGSMQKSTAIMQDMNTLIKLPQIGKVVQDLSRELTKSGVIDEMVTDMMDLDFEEDEFESENEEINDIINEVLGESPTKIDNVENKLDMVSSPVKQPQNETLVAQQEENEIENDDDDELLLNMRQRLSALQQ